MLTSCGPRQCALVILHLLSRQPVLYQAHKKIGLYQVTLPVKFNSSPAPATTLCTHMSTLQCLKLRLDFPAGTLEGILATHMVGSGEETPRLTYIAFNHHFECPWPLLSSPG